MMSNRNIRLCCNYHYKQFQSIQAKYISDIPQHTTNNRSSLFIYRASCPSLSVTLFWLHQYVIFNAVFKKHSQVHEQKTLSWTFAPSFKISSARFNKGYYGTFSLYSRLQIQISSNRYTRDFSLWLWQVKLLENSVYLIYLQALTWKILCFRVKKSGRNFNFDRCWYFLQLG